MAETKSSVAQIVRDWGQAVLIACAIGGGALTFASKALSWASAGPDAKAATVDLNSRVTRLERQSRFTVRALEKLSGMRYKRQADEEAE